MHKKSAAPCQHHKPQPPGTRGYSQETARTQRAMEPTFLTPRRTFTGKNTVLCANLNIQIASLMYQLQCKVGALPWPPRNLNQEDRANTLGISFPQPEPRGLRRYPIGIWRNPQNHNLNARILIGNGPNPAHNEAYFSPHRDVRLPENSRMFRANPNIQIASSMYQFQCNVGALL